jgi:hypothetical protein
MFFFHIYFAFAQILIQTVQLYIIQLYVSKFLGGTHTKNKWKYVDCVTRNRTCDCCLSVKHTQSSNLSLTSKMQSSLSFILSLWYLYCIGETRSAREAGISFIFPWFLVHLHSNLKVPCSNLTVDKQIYLQTTHTLKGFCFVKYISYLNKISVSMLTLERAVLKTWHL